MADDPLLIALRRKIPQFKQQGKDTKPLKDRIAAREAELGDPEDPIDEFHTGGGWYQIGDDKVQGKKAARALLDKED